MSVGNWIAIVSVSLTALGGMAALVQFLVKHYLAELKPNSGTSVKDQVTRLESRVDEIYRILLNKTLS
jgi:hypothetical protein